MEDKPKKKGMSEFFRKVARASYLSGWSTPKGSCSLFQKQFLVSEGEYAGTWLFERANGQLRYKYSPLLGIEDEANGSDKPFALKNWYAQQLSEFKRHAHLIQKLDWTAKPQRIVVARSDRHRYPHYWVETYMGKKHYYAYHLDATFGESAITLAARAGYDPVWLKGELTKIPGRVESLKLGIKVCEKLRSHKDRVSFSKKFLKTWSVNKSLPAWVKRPQRWKKLLALGMEQGTSLQWMKLVPENWTGIRHMSTPLAMGVLFHACEEVRAGRFLPMLGARPKIGEQREVFKKLVDPKPTETPWGEASYWDGFTQARHFLSGIRDGMRQWDLIAENPQYWPIVDPNNRWTLVVQEAAEKQELYTFSRYHDEITTGYGVISRMIFEEERGERGLAMKVRLEKAELHHQNVPVTADNLKYPCSCEMEFRVLSTYKEFLTEGEEMRHCISSYFVEHGRKHLLAIKGKDGERSSAEVSFQHKPVDVWQHRGFANGKNPSGHEAALKHHLDNCLQPTPKPEKEKEGVIKKIMAAVLNR